MLDNLMEGREGTKGFQQQKPPIDLICPQPQKTARRITKKGVHLRLVPRLS